MPAPVLKNKVSFDTQKDVKLLIPFDVLSKVLGETFDFEKNKYFIVDLWVKKKIITITPSIRRTYLATPGWVSNKGSRVMRLNVGRMLKGILEDKEIAALDSRTFSPKVKDNTIFVALPD